mmetsp:Transcript_131080/g.293225  ORF Transcript_131080/g.293225 Transcript_131080/m.293225 type:complete len:239 (-) Transcript_131080:1119-1835(-)
MRPLEQEDVDMRNPRRPSQKVDEAQGRHNVAGAIEEDTPDPLHHEYHRHCAIDGGQGKIGYMHRLIEEGRVCRVSRRPEKVYHDGSESQNAGSEAAVEAPRSDSAWRLCGHCLGILGFLLLRAVPGEERRLQDTCWQSEDWHGENADPAHIEALEKGHMRIRQRMLLAEVDEHIPHRRWDRRELHPRLQIALRIRELGGLPDGSLPSVGTIRDEVETAHKDPHHEAKAEGDAQQLTLL